MSKLKIFQYALLLAGLSLGAASCATAHPHGAPPGQVKKATKAHPHGGPPGQMKKGHGHPGKRH